MATNFTYSGNVGDSGDSVSNVPPMTPVNSAGFNVIRDTKDIRRPAKPDSGDERMVRSWLRMMPDLCEDCFFFAEVDSLDDGVGEGRCRYYPYVPDSIDGDHVPFVELPQVSYNGHGCANGVRRDLAR